MSERSATDQSETCAEEIILQLMEELSAAYSGLNTVPITHPARVVYIRAVNFLCERPKNGA